MRHSYGLFLPANTHTRSPTQGHLIQRSLPHSMQKDNSRKIIEQMVQAQFTKPWNASPCPAPRPWYCLGFHGIHNSQSHTLDPKSRNPPTISLALRNSGVNTLFAAIGTVTLWIPFHTQTPVYPVNAFGSSKLSWFVSGYLSLLLWLGCPTLCLHNTLYLLSYHIALCRWFDCPCSHYQTEGRHLAILTVCSQGGNSGSGVEWMRVAPLQSGPRLPLCVSLQHQIAA